MNIHVLAFKDCTPMVPVGFCDMLRKTSQLGSWVPGIQVRDDVHVTLVSTARDRVVTAAGGMNISCDATLKDVRRSDLVLVPAIDPDVVANLALNGDVVPWLRRMHLSGADLASACTGAFALAEAGLLNGKSAATHWAFHELFRQRYPKVRLEPQAVIVDQGRITTSGGATSFLTLSLYFIERIFGSEAARTASRLFLVDVNKSPQSAYAIFGAQKAHDDDGILRAQQLIEQQLAKAPTVEALAKSVAMSRRNFVRRFKRATGNSPRDYVQRVRVEAAKRSLEQGTHSVAEVSNEVGYEDAVAFRKLFLRRTGLTPTEYRVRYGQRTSPTFITRRRAAGP